MLTEAATVKGRKESVKQGKETSKEQTGDPTMNRQQFIISKLTQGATK